MCSQPHRPLPVAPVFLAPLFLLFYHLLSTQCFAQSPAALSNAFVNFETAPVHPIALSPDGRRLAVCNLADAKLELFDLTSGNPLLLGSVPVGLDPVSVRFRSDTEAWVVNYISDSISVVDVEARRVKATLSTFDSPADLVFAGAPTRAFVSCALPNVVQVFDPATRQWMTNVTVAADRPKALAVSPDGLKVYVAAFESGNGTTVVGGRFRNLLFFGNAVSLTNGPYGGQNPPPNLGSTFSPSLNPNLPTNLPTPPSGIIVRKNAAGHWLDDNAHDWTEFVSGSQAALTQRVPGWDLPDRDLAVLDTTDLSITYATGLMNLCMSLAVNPASGRIAVIGTDAINEVRFEPNLQSIFVRVKMASVDPLTLDGTVRDLNPHLDYSVRTLPPSERDRSIGDPRAIVWTADGTRGYVAGMGSRNLILIDADGNRLREQPLELGEGPCGLALDEARHRLYVFNRFSSSLSVVDTDAETVIAALPLFDPTPVTLAAGRRHLYDTRRTSGLGQVACASCHVDARMDRLGWDLGNPAGELQSAMVNFQGAMVTNRFHPMKGVMVTTTLQDIMGHEPFHWRGDRADLEAFNPAFINLQGAPASLNPESLRELKEFLASIRMPPNPYRHFDNSLSTNLSLNGQVALGENRLSAGMPLPNGNAQAGRDLFNLPGNFCVTCHTLPTGLGSDAILQGGFPQPVPPGTNGEHHFPVAVRLEGSLRSKIAQFRNLADRIGMDGTRTTSQSGFGFGHDGSIDSLTRFLNGVRVVPDQDVADLTAFLLSVAGSDTTQPGAAADRTPPASVGRQLTVDSSVRPALLDEMLLLARSPTSRVDLIAKGNQEGLARGWLHMLTNDLFQSDRSAERITVDELLALARPGNEITFTVVPRGVGLRLGLDRDLDGVFDRDELDALSNPADRTLLPAIFTLNTNLPVGIDGKLVAVVPPLPAPGTIAWSKDGQILDGESTETLAIRNASLATEGTYRVIASTAFQSWTSAPVRLQTVPLTVTASPSQQNVRGGSNALFSAMAIGLGPFHYQWQFQDQLLNNATNSSLLISNAQVIHEGRYQVTVANSLGVATSPPVTLGVLVNPALVLPPLSQRVVAGADATFSLGIAGHPPPFGYQLRKSSSILTNYVSDDRTAFFTLFNVQASNAGTYRIVITNAANPNPGLSLDPVTLTILADSDHDGLPDEWEVAHGLNANDASDAAADPDQDGQSNAEEYAAGTDPQDATSFLRVDRLRLDDGATAAVIQFTAASNHTYTVEYAGAPAGASWMKAADVGGSVSNRVVSVTNRIDGAALRYYRLATPRTP